MRTHTMTLLTIAAVLGSASAATAQTPPTPPPTPRAPVVAPAPMPVPMPRVVTLPEITLPPMTIDLPDVSPLIGIAPRALEASQLALERANVALDRANFELMNRDFHFDFQETPRFSYAISQDGDYSSGKDYANQGRYEQAIVRFDRVIARKGANVDGALFWKAQALFKLGKTEEALATIATLRKEHPQSRYLPDAKLLEADVRKSAGQPVNPTDGDVDDLKLLAIGALQHREPEQAVQMLEGVLNSNNSLRVKRKALSVLALNTHPRAYQVLLNYAKGSGNPDIQLEAIRYVTANRNRQQTSAKDLMDIYQSTQDTDVKLAIISAFRSSQNSTALSQIVSSGSSPVVVRTSALSGLTGILSPQDLWTLYERETTKELRLQMISAFGSMGAVDQLNRVIKTEKDPELRRRALRSLGNIKSEKTGQMLIDLYASEQDVESKKSIISSLYNQGNAEGLVSIARKESTLALKTEIVRRLSDMVPRSKVAADYLMEIIK